MIVTWATLHHISDVPHVEFGDNQNSLTHSVEAEVVHFKEGLTSFYTYRALLSGLKAASQHCK